MNSFQEESQGGRWRMGGVSKQDWNMQINKKIYKNKNKRIKKTWGGFRVVLNPGRRKGEGMATC